MSEEFTKFITVHNETKKITVLSEFEDLYNRIKNVYKNVSGFPKRFKVWHEDKSMEQGLIQKEKVDINREKGAQISFVISFVDDPKLLF